LQEGTWRGRNCPVPLYNSKAAMRTIWNGSISFGLVNIPVGLALATTPKAKQSDVSFRTLHRECKTPIRQKRWCPTHEREVGPDEIVKGWEVAKGEFVIVEDADLEAIQQHDDSRSIDITRFVPLDQVDPVYLDRTYYLAPAQAPAQRRPYVLLLEAMKDSEMGAIGRFVLRGAEYFALIRPKGEALVLETLFLAEGGIDYNAENFTGADETDRSAEIFGEVIWEWAPSGPTEANATAKTEISLDRARVRLGLDAHLRRDMFWNLYWSVHAFDDADSNPPDDRPTNSFGLSFGFGWSF